VSVEPLKLAAIVSPSEKVFEAVPPSNAKTSPVWKPLPIETVRRIYAAQSV